MKRLVLFDIDGTLINGGKLWREVFNRGLEAAFPGIHFPVVSFSGKTDRQICEELLRAAHPQPPLADRDGQIDHMIASYLRELCSVLQTSRAKEVLVLPGVRELLRHLLGDTRVTLGLLTGNVRQGAKLKLGAVGLSECFCVGAFGDDSADRSALPAVALRVTEKELGRKFEGRETVIIGDTHHDVTCGQSVCARSIAVGTGSAQYRQRIFEAGPDYFFETLEDTRAVVAAILA